MTATILFIDDDRDLLAAQTQGLSLAGLNVRAFSNGPDALRHVTRDFDGVILSDVRMPQMDGLAVLNRVQAIDPDLPVILLTGHGDVPMAVQALKDGAYDFLTKPFPMDDLLLSLKRALQKRQLVLENRRLRQRDSDRDSPLSGLLGNSPVMAHIRQTLVQIAEADVDLLVTGDTGVGKESAARTLHRLSRRRNRPFVHISCASLHEDTFQAELFGSDGGGSRGSSGRRVPGRLERAHRGTLFLDDVDGLSLSQQAALLQVIAAREVWSLGADAAYALDMRVVAASRSDLGEAVRRGDFRADLFYRLSGVSLRMPPLSDRPDDIPLLFQHFLVAACARLKRPVPEMTTPVHAHLRSHAWPGNVRELEQFAERLALGLDDARLPSGDETAPSGLSERVDRYEADILRETLRIHKGNAQAAITALQVARKTFYDKLNRHGIAIREYRG